MEQEQIAGITLCVIGLVLTVKPTLVWKLTESWKTERSSAPSDRYNIGARYSQYWCHNIGANIGARYSKFLMNNLKRELNFY
ncbi:MAG: hypothetical protein MRZ74_08305 [Blautia sp.]|nr:hypothetical protein [Blautia sp.]MDY5032752.1 hypothetical protein [Blautia sp.]